MLFSDDVIPFLGFEPPAGCERLVVVRMHRTGLDARSGVGGSGCVKVE
jgi:hypothetical protein